MRKVIGLVVLSLFVSACSGHIEGPYPMPAEASKNGELTSDVIAAGPGAILKQQAANQMAVGHLNEADSMLERALRFSPQDASVWYELALLRQQQNRPKEALQMLERANSYVGQNAPLADKINALSQRIEDVSAAST